jgi:hypothetical protein
MKNTLFDSELFVGRFGSYLLHVSSLRSWADLKGLYLPDTDPPIDGYKYVQVEVLLRAYVRDIFSITPADGFRAVQINPELNGEKFARQNYLARFLLATDASVMQGNLIVDAVKTGELKLLDFGRKTPITDEQLGALLASLSQEHIPSAGSDGLIDWLSRLPHTNTDAIERLQTESKVDDGETIASDAGQANTDALQIQINKKKPQIRNRVQGQMDAIIAALESLNYNPLCLPAIISGQSGAKAEVRKILDKKDLFTATGHHHILLGLVDTGVKKPPEGG